MGSEPEKRGSLFRARASARAAADRLPLSRPWRLRLTVVLSVTLAAVIGGPQVWPRTEEEKAIAVVEDVIDAYVDEDFDDLWELQATSARQCFAIHWEMLTESDGRNAWVRDRREALERETGLTWVDLIDMDPGEVYVAHYEAILERQPEEWEEEQRRFRALRVEDVSVVGNQASVTCRAEAEGILVFLLEKEEGHWRLCSLSPGGTKFRTLARKMAAFLPKEPIDAEEVDLVVEVGPSVPGAVAMLRTRLRLLMKEPPREVVLDASPEIAWQEVIRVYDALFLEGVMDVCFAASGDVPYAPGIRVNGVDVSETGSARAVDPAEHPAVRRIITCGRRPR